MLNAPVIALSPFNDAETPATLPLYKTIKPTTATIATIPRTP